LFHLSSELRQSVDTKRIVHNGRLMLALRQQSEAPLLKLSVSHRVGRASIGAKRNPESTRAILEAAETILREEGLAELSMDAIARRAHCGKPTLYRWWPDKASLLAEIHERALSTFVGPERNGATGEIDELVGHWLIAWRTTSAGIALRGMLAEAQGSEAARNVLHERGLMPYRASLKTVLDQGDRDVETTLRELLAPLLGQLMLDSEVTIAPARRPARAVYREVPEPAQPPAPSPATDSLVHRGEWVD
jgi:AcrR family transcriptional regulator